MAKPLTARDLARQAQLNESGKPPLTAQKIAEFVGFFVLLVIATLLGWQALQAQQRAAKVSALERFATDTQSQIDAIVSQAIGVTTEAIADPAMAQAIQSAPDPAQAEQAALAWLKPRLIDNTEVTILIGNDVLGALGERLSSYGFGRVSLLRQAESSGTISQVQLLLNADARRELALAAPIKGDGANLGFVLAFFEADRVEKAIAGWPGPGRVEVRQGKGDDYALYGSGDNTLVLRSHTRLPIRGSMISVAYAVSVGFLDASMGFLTLILLAAAALAGALALLLMRIRPELAHGLTQNRRRKQAAREQIGVPEAIVEAAAPVAVSGAAAESLPSVDAAKTDPPPQARTPSSAVPAVAIDRSIFRAYDIRGVVGKTLNADVANLIGRAVGSEVRARGLGEVVVARDGRLSGPELSQGLIDGLRASGCKVIDIGMVPTPVLYFATYELHTRCGVMLTGSHNPPDYNGFKIVIGGETLAEKAIQDLFARISEGRFSTGQGALQHIDVLKAYVERIASDIQLDTPLNIVVDSGNGVPGVIAEALFQAIGCEVSPLYCDVDGTFPNHHPDPSDPENLRDLMLTVKQTRADIGLAFDGDGDRLGIVTPKGKIIYPDRILMLFAQDVLTRNPGASIIYDVKCTGHLGNVIRTAGGVPIMWRTGHSLIKSKMRETGAELAGEMSGHFFFKERWFGFDDGLYAGCRLLEIIASSGQDVDALFDALPDSVSTPELKIPMVEGEHYAFMEKFKAKASFSGARITTIDGIRADWEDGWGLVRCSNTTPVLVLRFDADNEVSLQRIKDVFREQLLALNNKLKLPF